MKNKKEFIGIFLSVMISVFLIGLGVYATTTISSNIVTEGYVQGSSFKMDNNYSNVFLGNYIATTTTASYNTAVGEQAGNSLSDTSADKNTFMGYQAGRFVETGESNSVLGYGALGTSGGAASNNVAIGAIALSLTGIGGSDGHRNTAIGSIAGQFNRANNNIFLGYKAGDALSYGSNNIIIGYDVDAPSNTADNQLNIGDLIYGDLSTASAKYLGILDSSPAYTLSVDGTASVSGDFTLGEAGISISSGTASPSGNCTLGSMHLNSSANSGASANRIISVCDVTNEWSAVTAE